MKKGYPSSTADTVSQSVNLTATIMAYVIYLARSCTCTYKFDCPMQHTVCLQINDRNYVYILSFFWPDFILCPIFLIFLLKTLNRSPHP